MKKILILFCILLCTFYSLAQNTDLTKMSNTYLKASSYSMNIEMSMYKNCSKADSKEVYQGKVIRSGNNYYSELMGEIKLYNQSINLTIDETSKTVKCLPASTGYNAASISELFSITDSSYNRNYTIRRLSAESGFIRYEFTSKIQGLFNKMIVTIALPAYTLASVEYIYDEKSLWCKVEINYKDIRLNCKVNDEVFSEKKFINRVGNKIELAAKYKSYKLINRIKTKKTSNNL